MNLVVADVDHERDDLFVTFILELPHGASTCLILRGMVILPDGSKVIQMRLRTGCFLVYRIART